MLKIIATVLVGTMLSGCSLISKRVATPDLLSCPKNMQRDMIDVFASCDESWVYVPTSVQDSGEYVIEHWYSPRHSATPLQHISQKLIKIVDIKALLHYNV